MNSKEMNLYRMYIELPCFNLHDINKEHHQQLNKLQNDIHTQNLNQSSVAFHNTQSLISNFPKFATILLRNLFNIITETK